MIQDRQAVDYEDFGAVGDGVHDDLPAICEAHAHANSQGLTVRSRGDATYHLGRRALTAEIATDTDWNTSRFTIDDTDVEDHRRPLFRVISLLEPVDLEIDKLSRDQRRLALRPERDLYVQVENDRKKVYIRKGLNQSAGETQSDCFVLHTDGTIEGRIDWDYGEITRLEARPVDPETLTLRGGIFTTFANRMKQEVGYNYWARDIQVERSNTVIDGLTHYVAGETDTGHPYRGFLDVRKCAYIVLQNGFASGHKIYSTIGAAGLPVFMGSYDLHANRVVDLKILNYRMNHICDATRWGVIATNFCKNIVLEDCVFSRMDTHMGVSGDYILRRCELGHMGLNAIGRGTLLLEDSTLHGKSFINLRGDYGSTWDGEIHIRNSRWTPADGTSFSQNLISMDNDGTHDFGYPCTMPHTVVIDGLTVDDSLAPADGQGLCVFSDPDKGSAVSPGDERPFPYQSCEKVTVRNLKTASGKPLRISINPDLAERVVLRTED